MKLALAIIGLAVLGVIAFGVVTSALAKAAVRSAPKLAKKASEMADKIEKAWDE